MARELEKRGHSVLRIGTAHGAIDILTGTHNGKIDLVLLDITLGTSLSGLEVARYAQKKLPGLPIFAVTGGSKEQIMLEAQQNPLAGIPFFFEKDAQDFPKTLLETIDKLDVSRRST
jgi:CheY-like chemotaxis protein